MRGTCKNAFISPFIPFFHKHSHLPRHQPNPRTLTAALSTRPTLSNNPDALSVPVRASAATSPTSAYVHLPFCAQKCGYCDFAVTVSTSAAAHAAYVDTLVREIACVRAVTPSPAQLNTVYLGGGTPSLLSASEIARVLHALDDAFGVASDAEVTAEMDPATFDATKAAGFLAAGVTRVSVGAQSTDDRLLALCGRRHRAGDVHAALEALAAAGFGSVSVDVMAGLPTQTAAMYEETIREVLRHDVDHISAYDLSLEPGTPFARRYEEGVSPLPEERESVDMLEQGRAVLEREGFERYEVSNYARGGGSRSRHNLAYWHGMDFFGFGLSSTSLAHGVRFARPRVMSQYKRYVEGLQAQVNSGKRERLHEDLDAAQVLYPGVNKRTKQEILEEFLINRFRLLVEGVDLRDMRRRFAAKHVTDLVDAVRKSGFVEQGLMEIVSADGGVVQQSVRLTQRGAMIENSILSQVLQDAIWKSAEGNAT